jgi:hypothetical protein
VSNDYEQVKTMSNHDFDGKYDFLFFILLTTFRRDCFVERLHLGCFFKELYASEQRYMAELGSNAVFFYFVCFCPPSSYVSFFIFPLSSRFREMLPS